MKKTSIEDDILQTGLLLNEKYSPKYNKVYYSTNEDLNALLEVFDVKDKTDFREDGKGMLFTGRPVGIGDRAGDRNVMIRIHLNDKREISFSAGPDAEIGIDIQAVANEGFIDIQHVVIIAFASWKINPERRIRVIPDME